MADNDETPTTDIVLAEQALLDSVRTSRTNRISNYDPAQEVERSIVALIQHRIEKMDADDGFEASVKDAILARLPEAEFHELIGMLNILQRNSNETTEKILQPFIPRAGERVPLMDTEKLKKERIQEQKAIEDMPKDIKEGLAELSKFMKLVNGMAKEPKKKAELPLPSDS